MIFRSSLAKGTNSSSNGGNGSRGSSCRLTTAAGTGGKLAVNLSPEPMSLFGIRIPGTGSGYDLANENPAARYGKVLLTPYHTGKDPAQRHQTGYVWYDELIVATSRIPDPR